jgi:hypothetical protein
MAQKVCWNMRDTDQGRDQAWQAATRHLSDDMRQRSRSGGTPSVPQSQDQTKSRVLLMTGWNGTLICAKRRPCGRRFQAAVI